MFCGVKSLAKERSFCYNTLALFLEVNALKLFNVMNMLMSAVTTTSDIMRVIRIVCISILAVCAFALIVLVLLQPSASEGMSALSGQSYDSFYSQNKVRTPEGVMKRLTVVLSIVVVIVTIAFFVTGFWIKL